MTRDRNTDGMHPNLSAAAGLRIMLWARYRHLRLRFTMPPESEKFEASWNGGNIVAVSEDELLSEILERLQDCGSEEHKWVTTSEERGPEGAHSILLTQRLECIYCDSRQRVIEISEAAGESDGE